MPLVLSMKRYFRTKVLNSLYISLSGCKLKPEYSLRNKTELAQTS
jgi:hypothetical protein